ncbi:hypothetical protein ACHAW6_004805 [Cyclotella cf. meneghiniana]
MNLPGNNWTRSCVSLDEMTIIGYEDCDYISHEMNWFFWKIHSQMARFTFNHHAPKKLQLACNTMTDEEFFESVKECLLYMDRYNHKLLKHFEFKCYDFEKQITSYMDFMSGILSRR